jgi:hypothetical protein
MCGLFGYFSKDPACDRVALKGRLVAAQVSLHHRGPDDRGLESFSIRQGNNLPPFELTFGHTRLSIIDLSSSGHQPMHSDDGRIDWNQSAIKIIRLINACNKPYAGAFCEFEDEKLIIWDAELVSDGEVFFAVPGQVTKIGDGFIEIACKDGKIAILTCEINRVIYKPSTLIRSIRKRLN